MTSQTADLIARLGKETEQAITLYLSQNPDAARLTKQVLEIAQKKELFLESSQDEKDIFFGKLSQERKALDEDYQTKVKALQEKEQQFLQYWEEDRRKRMGEFDSENGGKKTELEKIASSQVAYTDAKTKIIEVVSELGAIRFLQPVDFNAGSFVRGATSLYHPSLGIEYAEPKEGAWILKYIRLGAVLALVDTAQKSLSKDKPIENIVRLNVSISPEAITIYGSISDLLHEHIKKQEEIFIKIAQGRMLEFWDALKKGATEYKINHIYKKDFCVNLEALKTYLTNGLENEGVYQGLYAHIKRNDGHGVKNKDALNQSAANLLKSLKYL